MALERPAEGNGPRRGLVAAFMRHVFGIAFSRVEMDTSARQELELLFLRLAYSVKRVADDGDEARGYLAVLRQEASDAVRRLKTAYGVGDEVRTVFTSLLVSDLARLADAAEQVKNGEDQNAEREVAGQIANAALHREIASQEPSIRVPEEGSTMPFGVQWDYYATVPEADTSDETSRPLCPRLL